MAYFCVAELLANVSRHSRASRAAVRINGDVAALRIIVEDNGSGGAQVGNGSGLAGLRDRLAMLDGHGAVAAHLDEASAPAVRKQRVAQVAVDPCHLHRQRLDEDPRRRGLVNRGEVFLVSRLLLCLCLSSDMLL